MPLVVATETTEFESDDTRPEFEDLDVTDFDKSWDKTINFNLGIVGRGERPMRWPFRSAETELTIDGTFLPKEYNQTLMLINDTIDGLSVYIQSEDNAGVWVKKT